MFSPPALESGYTYALIVDHMSEDLNFLNFSEDYFLATWKHSDSAWEIYQLLDVE